MGIMMDNVNSLRYGSWGRTILGISIYLLLKFPWYPPWDQSLSPHQSTNPWNPLDFWWMIGIPIPSQALWWCNGDLQYLDIIPGIPPRFSSHPIRGKACHSVLRPFTGPLQILSQDGEPPPIVHMEAMPLGFTKRRPESRFLGLHHTSPTWTWEILGGFQLGMFATVWKHI